MKWQKFETAPKDGSVFLCAWRSGKVTLLKWFGEYFHWETMDAVCCSSSLLQNSGSGSYSDKEMYWMPLPKPPSN